MKKRGGFFRNTLERHRNDFAFSIAVFLAAACQYLLCGEYVFTLCGLKVPVTKWYSPSSAVAVLIALCILLPKVFNWKRLLALLAAAAVINQALFNGGLPGTGKAPPRKGTPGISVQAEAEKWNVFAVGVDSLRPDALGAYGATNFASVNIDFVASHGLVFDNAYSNAPAFLSSHSTFLTGLYPTVHGAAFPAMRRLPQSAVTLAEALAEAGFMTAAFVERGQLDSFFGTDQGFQVYDDTSSKLEETVEKTLSRLRESRDRRFFLLFHTSQVLAPYNPPPPFHRKFSPGYRGRLGYVIGADVLRAHNEGGNRLTPPDVRHVRALYDSEVAYTDHHLGRIFRYLRDTGMMGKTLLVLFSSHGAEFDEHGFIGGRPHALYEELIRVPLIVHVPGLPPSVVKRRVSLVDAAPSILRTLGLPPPPGMQGTPFLPDPALPGEEGGPVFAEKEPDRFPFQPGNTKCLIYRNYKFIRVTPSRGIYAHVNLLQKLVYFARGRELYDLAKDPGEKSDLILRLPEVGRRLEGMMNEKMNENYRVMLRGKSPIKPGSKKARD
ncbi:MAG: sulfatase [bacterium]